MKKKNLIEFSVLFVVLAILFGLFRSWEWVTLCTLGFIWNWASDQDLTVLFQNKRYRFSTLRMIKNFQSMIVKPAAKLPAPFHHVLKALPAGIFWTMVIYLNDADMPWPATFLGSFLYEFLQLEQYLFRKPKEPVA